MAGFHRDANGGDRSRRIPTQTQGPGGSFDGFPSERFCLQTRYSRYYSDLFYVGAVCYMYVAWIST